MPLTQEQIKELKFQLSQQIQNLPEDKKLAAQQQIESLSPEALEYMLKEQTSSGKTLWLGMCSGLCARPEDPMRNGENTRSQFARNYLLVPCGYTWPSPKEVSRGGSKRHRSKASSRSVKNPCTD